MTLDLICRFVIRTPELKKDLTIIHKLMIDMHIFSVDSLAGAVRSSVSLPALPLKSRSDGTSPAESG
jgi:hypothetical protein